MYAQTEIASAFGCIVVGRAVRPFMRDVLYFGTTVPYTQAERFDGALAFLARLLYGSRRLEKCESRYEYGGLR